VTSPNAQVQPLRITLAWTDPPGDPAAAVKLVNNLVLVVTNLDTGTIYYGNDIAAGNTFNTPETTNAPPNIDSINNVQNVYISPLNGTNFSMTVLGYRVNVNAVTAHPNNVVQDYALVVSSGDGAVSNAMTVSATSPASAAPPVTGSNPTGDQQISYISANNAAQLNQFVGANTPLLGTNTVVFSTTAPEGFGPNNWQVTVGMTNQWHFYVVTNSLELSNAAFVTFIPDTLSIPRMGVFADSQANATTLEADIDLYVTTDPSITNLDPAAISNCVVGTQVGAAPGPSFAGASLGRGGTELVVDTNSQSRAPNVYYIGVKSERQVAAEYGFISIFSAEPFSQMDTNGNETVIGHPVPVEIPGGSPALPGFTNVFAFAIYPIQARAVIVTNELYAEDLGDLVGSIYHSGLSVILNNHTLPVNGPGFYSAIYDDSGQGGFPGSIHSAGPGSLHDFIGKDGSGVWVLHESDNATGFSNSVENLTAIIQPHVNSALGTEAFAVPAGGWFYDFVDVPPGATSMTVTATNTPPLANPPLELFVKLGSAPTTNSFDAMTVINNPGPGGTEWGTVTLGPPLASGRYFIGIFNPSATTANGAFFTTIVRPFAPAQTIYNSPDAPIPILDDAVTTDSINVTDHQFISSMDVAISVQHPRISDLVFHLISPDGTRELLMENRGGTDPNGAGGVASIVTVTNINSTFENAPATNYTFGQPVDGWDVIGNQVSVVTDPTNAYQGTNFLALANGTISATLATVPGQTYTLNFAYRGPGIVGWWRGESNAVAVDYAYQNNGALVGGVSYTTGKVDQAFLFSGTGSPYTSRINVPDSPSYILTNGLTIEGWVWASNYVASGQGGIILFRGDDRLGLDPYWMEIDHGTQNLSFSILQFNGTGLTTLNYNFAPWLQQWVHLAGTWDGHSGLMNLYVNGTIVAQAVSPYVPIGALTGPNPGIGIGNNQSTGYNTPWVGSLDEVSLYGRALSASEIKAIYTDGINGNPAGGNGKFDPNRFQLSPRQSLAEAQISVNGSVLTNFFGDNTTWQTYTVSFTASNSITPLQIQGVEPGILLDNIGVVSVQTNYSYLVFTENTNLTTTPIKFAIPPFSAVSTNSANNSVTVWHNSFENFPTVYNLYSAGSYFCGGWHVDSGDIEVVTNGGWYGSTPYGTNNYFMDLNGSQAGTISTNIATSSGQTYILSFAYARNPNSIGAPVPPTVQVLINNNPLGTVADNRMNSWGNLGWQTTSFVFTATAPVTTLTFQSLVGSASGMFLDAVALATPISPYYLPEQPLDTFDGLNAQGAWTLEVQDDRVGATNPAPQLLNWQLRFTYVTTGTNAAGIPPGTTATNIIPANGWAYYPVNVPPSADWATNILVFATGPLNMWFNPTNNPVAGPADSELAAGVISDTAPLSLTSSPTNIVPGTTYYIGLFNPNTFPVTNGFQVNFHLIPPPISLTNGVPITNTFSASLGISVTGHSLVTYDVTVPPNVDFVTNTLISATLPVNLWFNQNVTPNGTYPPNYELLSNSTGGSFVLSATSIPQLAPGLTYHLALENTNGVPVTTAFIVHFHFMSTNPITGPGITMTNVGGTNGFLVQWSGPTNYDYSIQWKTNLAPVFPWNTISNPVINVTYIPPNGNYSWFDDGSQTGGWPPQKFYRVTAALPPTVLTNSTPFTNGVPAGALDQFEVSVPTNATAATNLLISASGPVDVYFNQTGPPNGNNPGSYVMLSNVTSGSFTLTGGTLPPLVPGATYNIGIKNLGSGQVTFVYQVNFGYSALATNPPPTPSIAVTNIGGTNAILLQWVAPTNYQFQVQWTRNLASPITWHTISNVVVTWSGVVSPTNSTYGIFQFLDDGSLTGGLGVRRFYRLIEYPYSAPIPQALTIVNTAILGSAVQFQWMAPTNYQYQVLWTTNLALPLGSWSVLANPVLGLSNGVYIFTDTNQTGPPTGPKFFRVLEQ
jgi:subtilisin-like proprotein convertase family protein